MRMSLAATVAMPMPARRRTLLPGTTLIITTALRLSRAGGVIIKTLGAFAHDAATDEAFQRAQFAVIFRRHEADRVADGVRAPGTPDAMHVIFHVHREIVIHHV